MRLLISKLSLVGSRIGQTTLPLRAILPHSRQAGGLSRQPAPGMTTFNTHPNPNPLVTMSPALPEYTKSAFLSEEGHHESDGLLRHSGEDEGNSRATTYPPTTGGEASTSSTAGATEPIKTFALPSHLANYKLDSQFMLYTEKTAICGRSRTRLETIDNLVSVFPILSSRDPSTIQFKVACPPPAGSTQPSWTLVTEAVWDDVIVRGKPDNIMVCVAPNKKEYRQQWIRAVALFSSPVWVTGTAFGVLGLCGQL